MPAAQEGTSETLFCFLAMSGPHRWNRGESTARGSAEPPPSSQDQGYISEDSHYDDVESTRKSREFPSDMTIRTRRFRETEDHNQYNYGYRDQCQWYQDSEYVKLSAKRSTPGVEGPRNMPMFVKRQMLMDAVSWALFWENKNEFDPFTRWQADFIRHIQGWLTQHEEDEFVKTQKAINNGIMSKKGSQYFRVSKAFSGFLRHSEKLFLFDTEGTANIGSVFSELAHNNPIKKRMSPCDFAALLLCNDKARFHIKIYVNWTWKPMGIPTQPWDLRLGAVQGHSNEVVPYTLHHPLTIEEANCLGWIFHVTSAENRQRIERQGLLRNPYGRKGFGRDSIHFMYHNDNSKGYIRMADGTVVPRNYRNPIYCVLVPHATFEFQPFLSKNGVILIYQDIPPHLLKIVEQKPTIACPVMQPGRGHVLSPTVTGGTWPDDISYDRMKAEKGAGFVPNGEIPDQVRVTAWDFMGQTVPQNYGMLVFSQPLTTRDQFDPKAESVYGLIQGSSLQKEEPTQAEDVPMRDPYTQPRGSSPQGEGPRQDTSTERWWEEHRSSPGSPEEPEELSAAPHTQEQQDQDDDVNLEAAAALWETEEVEEDEHDPVIEITTSPASSTNPWFLYEAGIICARSQDGKVVKNSSRQKAINLREWALLVTNQRIRLRRQEITRPVGENTMDGSSMLLVYTCMGDRSSQV